VTSLSVLIVIPSFIICSGCCCFICRPWLKFHFINGRRPWTSQGNTICKRHLLECWKCHDEPCKRFYKTSYRPENTRFAQIRPQKENISHREEYYPTRKSRQNPKPTASELRNFLSYGNAVSVDTDKRSHRRKKYLTEKMVKKFCWRLLKKLKAACVVSRMCSQSIWWNI
jgi:predicted HNH restriction endonuclease